MSDTRYPTDSGVSIRDATESDILAIQDIARLTWADTYRDVMSEDAQAAVLSRAYSKESIARSIGRSQAFLVAEVSEAEVSEAEVSEAEVSEAEVDGMHGENGRCLAGYVDLDFDGRQMNLYRLYILPEYQRLGLGRRLLQAAVAQATGRAATQSAAQATAQSATQSATQSAAQSIAPSAARATAQISSATTPTPAGVSSVAAKRGSPSHCCLLVAHVERDNPKARAFYKKMGFSEDEEEIVVIGGVSLPVVRISMTVGGEEDAL